MFSSPGPIALQVGPLAIRWYGLLIATGVLLGTALAHREAERRRLDPDQMLNAIVVGVMVSLVGARLYYVLFNWGYYGQHPGKIIAVWEGGLAIHGGIIGGSLAIVAYTWWKGISRRLLLVYFDVFAPCVALGQSIGRWGNFFNQEAFGVPANLPWKLYIDPYHRPPPFASSEYFHPTFLYESLWDLLVFLALWFGLRRRVEDRPGALTLFYLGLYSIGRFFVEGLRTDSLMLGSLRAAQIVSVVLVGCSVLGLAFLFSRKRQK